MILSRMVFAQTAIAPGEYGDMGNVLTIAPVKNGQQLFELHATGGNFHICTVAGDIKSGKAVIVEQGFDEACVVKFKVKNTGIEVETEPEHNNICHTYCGARAWFAGFYPKNKQGCDSKSRKNALVKSDGFYHENKFAQAEKTLLPILKNCSNILHWSEAGYLANAVARAQAKQGHWNNCLETLKPYIKDAEKPDDKVCDQHAATHECESYRAIIEQARETLLLCQQTPE
jgi:hypothetical protein